MLSNQEGPEPRRAAVAALLLAAACAAAPSAVPAGVNEWTQAGPEGGWLCDLAAAPSDPSILYARGETLFRSTDDGATWESRGGVVDAVPCFLRVDAADPQRLYGIEDGEFLRSLDGGTTWNASADGLPELDVWSTITVDLHDANFLIFVSLGRIYRSRDRADSWTEIAGPTGATVEWIEVDPVAAGSLWLLSGEGEIFRSSDFGDTWVPLSSNLPAQLEFHQLVFDAHEPGLAYLSTSGGSFRTQDGGAHWTALASSGTFTVGRSSILFRLETGIFIVPQIYRSFDLGETWQQLPSNPFAFVPRPGGLWLLATPNALFGGGSLSLKRSLDDGDTWQDAVSGLTVSSVRSFEVDRQNPDSFYGIDVEANRAERLVRSQDRGATWSRLNVAPPEGRPYLIDLVVDPNDSRHLLAATALFSSSGVNGLLDSWDGGLSWTLRAIPATCLLNAELAFDILQPGRILLLAGPGPGYCQTVCPVQISEDSGASWRCSELPDPDDRLSRMVPSPFAADLILAVGNAGIYRTIDAGVTWTRVAEEPTIPGSPPGFAVFNDVAWATAERAYASNERGGLYVSQDAGATWAPASGASVPVFPWLGEIAVDPIHPGRILALARPGPDDNWFSKVVHSDDGGLTWVALSAGLAGWSLSDLTIDPVTPNRFYVSATGGGVLIYDRQQPELCAPSETALCITDGRFKIESIWRDFTGRSGVGHAVPLASDTGSFWFFDPDNLELFVKEIDGVSFNNAFWTFYGALSNVEFTVLATDTATGAQHGYFNPIRTFASRGDIESFPQGEGLALPASAAATSTPWVRRRAMPLRSANACVPDATTLCLAEGRFAASVTWSDFAGRSGVGTPIILTPDTGSFWFFDAGIHELAVKVIDGRGTNNAYWVFYGSLSNVQFDLTVVDTVTGEIWTRANPSGTFASGGDIEAFPQQLP